jgi:hypothetical protein
METTVAVAASSQKGPLSLATQCRVRSRGDVERYAAAVPLQLRRDEHGDIRLRRCDPITHEADGPSGRTNATTRLSVDSISLHAVFSDRAVASTAPRMWQNSRRLN